MTREISCVRISHTTYAVSLTHALIAYAESHDAFRAWFTRTLRTLTLPETSAHTPPAGKVTPLMPHDDTQAMRRVAWLLETIRERRTTGHEEAAALLATWGNAQTEPQGFVVLGLKYGVLDYGIIGEPRRHHETMTIVINGSLVNDHAAIALAPHVTAVTHSVVEQGLITAHGHTAKLEPELGDWLFGDKEMVFFSAPAPALAALHDTLQHIGVPTGTWADGSAPQVIAICPSVQVHACDEYEALTELAL